MATPLSSPPTPSPTGAASQSPSTLKRTRKVTRLRSLANRQVGAERPLVHVNPATGKADGPHRKKLRTYLGIVAHDKAEYDIPEAFDLRTKKENTSDCERVVETIQLTRKVSTTLYAKSMALATRSGPNFVKLAKTLCGRMYEKRHRQSRSKTLPLTCCLVGGAVGPAKPADRPEHDVDDPLYFMTLTIPQLFLKSLHMTETSMQAGNADVHGFLEPQSIQRSGKLQFESKSYIKN
ncbi:hypothetical protein GmHk_12G034859 [Glycine max]|nr:hypothetical protein GmHk_12G034859 [Glycine max]